MEVTREVEAQTTAARPEGAYAPVLDGDGRSESWFVEVPAALLGEVARFLSSPRLWHLSVGVRGVVVCPSGGVFVIDALRFEWLPEASGDGGTGARHLRVRVTAVPEGGSTPHVAVDVPRPCVVLGRE